MTTHDPRHEERLIALLAGDLSPEDPAARELLASCAECRERLAELRALQAELDEAGARERSFYGAALAAPGRPEDAARVESILRAAASGTSADAPRARHRSHHRWYHRRAAAVLLIAGAAALLALSLRALLDRDPAPPDPILGSGGIEAVSPRGEVGAYPPFEWRGTLPPQGWFEVRVLRPGAPPGAPPLAESGPIGETRWSPANGVARLWPEEIEWEVRAFDAEGSPRGASGRVPASLRPR